MSQGNLDSQDDEQSPKQWHLDKTVSITHIFSTVAAVTAMVICLSKFDTRVTILEQASATQNLYQAATDARQDKEADQIKQTIGENYRAIDDKLQRLIERQK